MRNDNMSIFTKKGDYGVTSLLDSKQVSKSDDRIQLVGTIDELTSHLGLIKASHPKKDIKNRIEHIQENLKLIMAGTADQYNRDYRLKEEEITQLEEDILYLEGLYPKITAFILPGDNALSAQIDIARTIARRMERTMVQVSKVHSLDSKAKKYANRLSDYLYVVARYTDFLFNGGKSKEKNQVPNSDDSKGDQVMEKDGKGKNNQGMTKEEIVSAVISRIGVDRNKMTLKTAKMLIDKVEEYSRQKGLNAVIAICGPDGNPIAVHVMDDAFLASYNIAMNKAYTSVAVKMSTMDLSKLAAPGETFYGIDKSDDGRISIIGGGVPLKIEGNIIGGLGVSGGTGEEDSDIAEYGLKVLKELL